MFVKDAKNYTLWKFLSCKKGPVVAEWKPKYASVFVVVRFIVEKLKMGTLLLYSVFSCQYHFTNATYSLFYLSTTLCSLKKWESL
jgi:hypothetical protein